MPQPPLHARSPQAIEQTKDIDTSCQARRVHNNHNSNGQLLEAQDHVVQDIDASCQVRKMQHRHNGRLLEALDNVVQEYSQKLSELSHLTANLPKRLHLIDDGSCKGSAPRYHKDDVRDLPIPAAGSHLADDSDGPTQSPPRGQELRRQGSNQSHADAIAIAAVNANSKLDGELAKEEAKQTPAFVRAAEHAVVAVETKISDVIRRMETGMIKTSCCSKICRKICPSLYRSVRDASVQKTANHETDYLKDHLQKASNSISGRIDMIIGVLILANCGAMMVQLEYTGYKSEISLGDKEDDGSWDNADTYFTIFEHIFNALFILELVVRFAIDGSKIFCDGGIALDILLVMGSSIQIYILDPLEMDGGMGVNLSLFRMLRFVKFIKIFRLVRVLKLFSHLRVLVKTIASSFGALIWSMILLLVIMVMSGMFLTGLLEDFINNPDNNLSHRKWVFKYYGSASRAIYTLFEITLAGCWPTYVRPLIEHVSTWYVLFALFYISVVVFAIIRIITAIFLKETLAVAGSDSEMMLQERVKQKEIYINKLQSVFRAVDTSGDGTLSIEEFMEIVENPLVKVWLQLLELEVHDADGLFRLLDNGDGEITYDEFLKGVMRLKGQARSTDIVAVMHSTDKTLNLVTCIMERVLQLFSALDPSFKLDASGLPSGAPPIFKREPTLKHWLQ